MSDKSRPPASAFHGTENQRLGILLGAESLIGRRSGVGRMTLQIAHVLRTHPAVAGLSLVVDGRPFGFAMLDALSDGEDATASASGSNSERGLLSAVLEKTGAGAVLSAARGRLLGRRMGAAADALRRSCGAPVVYHETNMIARPFDGVTVVTVNDLSWRVDRAMHPRERVDWIERKLDRSLAQAARFVAISSFTSSEMVRHLGVDPARIDVVPLAPSPAFRPLARDRLALARFGLGEERFVLSVSTLEPRKNFDRLLAAHAALPEAMRARHPLVVAGGQGWGQTLETPLADQAIRAGSLRLLGHVSDDDLVALYNQCVLFAYPSLYEGFGLPILEAMACGAPVVTSSTTAAAETAGDAGVLVEPTDEAAIAGAMRRVIEDEAARDRLCAAGLAHARSFTWERTTDLLLETWRKAVREAQGG